MRIPPQRGDTCRLTCAEVDELTEDRGKTGDDIDKEYKRNTVTDTVLIDLLCEPHYER